MKQKKAFWLVSLLTLLLVFGVAASGALAADVDNSNTEYVYVAPGQSVIGEQQTVTEGSAAELGEKQVIYIDLPAGLTFNSAPLATVSAEDLLLDNGGVPGNSNIAAELTNDNTRAIWTVYAASTAASTVKITNMDVALASDYDFGENTSVELKLTIGAGTTIDNDNVVAVAVPSLVSPAQALSAATLQQDAACQDASGTEFVVTLPAGTVDGDDVTFTLPAGQEFAGTPSAAVLNDTVDDATPVDVKINVDDDEVLTLTAKVDIVADTQVKVGLDKILTHDAPLGDLNAEIGGTAGLAGSVKVAEIAASGTTNEVSDTTLKDITRGAQVFSAVSDFTLKEIFDTDLRDEKDFTITLPDGLTFNGAGSCDHGDTALSTDKRTITVTVVSTDSQDTLTISSLEVKAAASFTGSEVQVTLANDADYPAGITEGTLVLANVVDPAVTVTGPDPVPVVGVGADDQVLGQAAIEESTYGSIRQGQTIQLNAPAGVTIKSATIAGEASTLDLTDLDSGTYGYQGFIAPDGSYAYWTVVGESTAAETGLTLDVKADIAASVAPGTDLVFTFTGDSNITGDVTLAKVEQTTVTSRSTGIALVTPGLTDPQSIATITIEENFAGALGDGYIRVIAPAGVSFPEDDSAFTLGDGVMWWDTVSTFNPGDTVILRLNATGEVDTFSIGLAAYIASGVDGNIAFQVVDGDGSDPDTLTGITEASDLLLAYAGTPAAMSADPASANVTVGETADVAVTGGIGDYSVATSDDSIATATLSDGTVTITGVAEGDATITVSDSADPANSVAIAVTVEAAPVVENGFPADPMTPVDFPATVDPSATPVVVNEGAVSIAPQLTVADCADVASVVAYVWMPAANAGVDVSALVTKNCDAGVLTVDFGSIDFTGFPGTYDIYYGYVDGEGAIHYSAYQLTVQ